MRLYIFLLIAVEMTFCLTCAAFENGECIEQQADYNFLIERSVGPSHYLIRIDRAERNETEDFIANSALIIVGGPVQAATFALGQAVAQDEAPKPTSVTRQAILKSFMHVQSMPEKIRRIGKATLNGKQMDLWEICT